LIELNGLKIKRVLLKLSGEALAGSRDFGIEAQTLDFVAEQIDSVIKLGVEVAIVVGGGNIFRGIQGSDVGIDRSTGDHMGMLATVINSLALQNTLEKKGIHTRVQSAIRMEQVVEPYIKRKATRHLEKGRVVIFASGTGNPYFSTDTAAALRAMEVGANILIKATNVDYVYDSDPRENKDAKKIKEISYIDVLNKNLKVMDSTAISLCMDNKLPIQILSLQEKNSIADFIQGKDLGTRVS